MKDAGYIITLDLDLPPLRSGLKPTSIFGQYPTGKNLMKELVTNARRLWALMNLARHCQVMALDSVSGKFHPDLLFCIFLRLKKKRPLVIMANDMWNRGGGFKYLFQKTMIHLADACIHRYVVHSLGEAEIFAQLWDVAPQKVRTCIYNYTFTDQEINSVEIKDNGYIFAGGNTGRDYELLLETARQLPHRQFILATRTLNGYKNLPANVKVVTVSHPEFIRLMAEADMVVTPLASRTTKSAGQQTYLNAMRMGKVSIVNGKDVFGVTDYIQNCVNGIITDGTPQGFCEAIEWVYNPANLATVNQIKKLAQETVMEFSYERYLRTMASIIEEAIESGGR